MKGQQWTRRVAAAAAVTLAWSLAFALPTPSASAATTNSVITWNANAQTAIWDIAQQAPWVTGRSFAMVQGAVYDAVNAIHGTPYQPYLVAPRAAGTESVDAAVATAAHQVLLHLFPGQQARLQAEYDQFMAPIPNGAAKQGGIMVGRQAAAAMISARQNDGAFGNELFPVGSQPGQWRPVPPQNSNAGAWVANLRPFFITSPSAFRTAGPPALSSQAYAWEVNEVKAIGSVNSATRTADQTDSAKWWHDRRLVQWEINRQLATTQGLNLLDSARMMAMVNLVTADANTACFNEKANWRFWRPTTAIRLADTDGNPATEPDTGWAALLVTPGSPDYTSGHACYTGAAMATLAYFFGRDTVAFSAFSPFSNSTRSFSRFSQALAEVIEARIWGGIHFRSADVQGAKLGAAVAAYMIAHQFRRR